ncbi:hypothetical protein [Viridibacterium curvum]|uniref:hypothetical protein n=1 Tax=Viridibacterium curvum TaxID=1101404 RepID=UPI0031ED0512
MDLTEVRIAVRQIRGRRTTHSAKSGPVFEWRKNAALFPVFPRFQADMTCVTGKKIGEAASELAAAAVFAGTWACLQLARDCVEEDGWRAGLTTRPCGRVLASAIPRLLYVHKHLKANATGLVALWHLL